MRRVSKALGAVFLLLVSFVIVADAAPIRLRPKFLMGEMESSGAPELPDIPDRPLNYNCEIELSRSSRLSAKAKRQITLKSEAGQSGFVFYKTAVDGEWTVEVAYKNRDTLERGTFPVDWLSGHSIGLGVSTDRQTGREVTSLSVTAVHPTGTGKISTSHRATRARSDGRIEAQANLSISAGIADLADDLSLDMKVMCVELAD